MSDTQPAQMNKLGVFQFKQKKRQFLNRLQGELAKRGIIDVLRNGIKVRFPALPKIVVSTCRDPKTGEVYAPCKRSLYV